MYPKCYRQMRGNYSVTHYKLRYYFGHNHDGEAKESSILAKC